MANSECRLWRSWRDTRDGDAFAALVRPHLAFAERLARRAGCTASDADDVVQRSLVRLASESRDVPVEVGVRAWIGRNVLSESRMLFRARTRREAHERRAPPRPAEPATGEPIGVRDEIEAALLGLRDDERRVVELRYLHDLDYKEIAFIEGASAIACRLRVHRAMKRLRQRLGGNAALAIAAIAGPPSSPAAAGHVVARAVDEAMKAPLPAGRAASRLLSGGMAMGATAKVVSATIVMAVVAAWGWLGAGGNARERADVAPSSWSPSSQATDRVDAQPPAVLASAPAGRTLGADRLSAPSGGDVASAGPDPLDAPTPADKATVVGTIRFDDGTPFGLARVGLDGVGAARSQVAAQADVHGRFRIDVDEECECDLVIAGERQYTLSLGRRIPMRLGERAHVDLEIRRGRALDVEVVDAVTRAPIAGAAVTVRRPDAHVYNLMQAGFGWVRTDGTGHARFDLLPDAAYSIAVVADKHETVTRIIDVGAATAPLVLEARPSRRMVVRLVGLPNGAAGKTVSWVADSDVDDDHPVRFLTHGTSALNTSGEFVADAPPPGSYWLTLDEGAAWPQLKTRFDVTAGDDPIVSVPLPSGIVVEGVLHDGQGRPVTNARVLVGPAPAVQIGDDGRFRAAGVASGKNVVVLSTDEGTVTIGEVDAPSSGSVSVSLVTPGTAGLVGSLPERIPWSAASLTTEAGFALATAEPDLHGRIRFSRLAPGPYTLRVRAQDVRPIERRVTLVAGEATDVGELRFASYPAVPVHVVYPPGTVGTPILFTRVERSDPEGLASDPNTTGRIEYDDQGRAWLRGLPAGAYRLRVCLTSDPFGGWPAEVTVRDGVTTPVEIVLR